MNLFKRQQPSSESREERRRSLRISKSIIVNYQIGTDILRPDCRTKDISEVGILLNIFQKIATGTTLKLYIYFPDDTKPILFFGKVVWIREAIPCGNYPFEVGIEFDFVDPSLRHKIKSYLQSIS